MSEYLTIKELAERWRGCERTARQIVKDNLPHIRPGNKILVKLSVVEAWEDRQATEIKGDEEVMDFLKDLAGVA